MGAALGWDLGAGARVSALGRNSGRRPVAGAGAELWSSSRPVSVHSRGLPLLSLPPVGLRDGRRRGHLSLSLSLSSGNKVVAVRRQLAASSPTGVFRAGQRAGRRGPKQQVRRKRGGFEFGGD